ncbi:hypothetical protein M407DRAFT_17816 [Tulasnella calospora MUT 4182]|uniref:Uncharacterized protein n=1 Tax=Tulasnella calospora MUT 4182 TaxID=1051891 RepID=A0A0C3MHW2_9AGAM|nr:hypothetical protein M407DRAFT_17816 [Tulasnella calospora MUT 4182]
MESLPEEIWLLIFKFVRAGVPKPSRSIRGEEFSHDLARRASLRPLSETCHTFHRICQPLLFETLVIQYYRHRVVDVLRSKPHLKSMVSRVRIGWALPGRDRKRDLLDRLEKALMELHSVRDVWIWGADISTTLLDHFQQCPRLARLALTDVYINHPTEPTPLSFHSLKFLRCIPHRNLQATNFFPTLTLPELEILHIGSVFLSGAANSPSHQVIRFNPSVLKELTIESRLHPESMEAGLVELLKRANGIKSLSLDVVGEFSRGFSLTDDLIPELEAFRGRADSVLTFCKGRPVRNLVTCFPTEAIWKMANDVPNLIRPGSVSLEHLSIDWTLWKDDTMGYIAKHCPQLISLKIRARRLRGALLTRDPMPHLRRATFLSSEGSWFPRSFDSHLKPKREARVVQGCRKFWTQLEYLRLDPGYFWSYRGPEVERVQGEEEEWY